MVDAHLDLAWNALSWNRDLTQSLEACRAAESAMTDHPARGRGTVTLPEMRRGGVFMCLGTLLARANPAIQPVAGHMRRHLDFVNQDVAHAVAMGQLAYYNRLQARREITIKIGRANV